MCHNLNFSKEGRGRIRFVICSLIVPGRMTNVENIYSDYLRSTKKNKLFNFHKNFFHLPYSLPRTRQRNTFSLRRRKEKNVKISIHTSKLVPFDFCSSTTASLSTRIANKNSIERRSIRATDKAFLFSTFDNLADSFILAGRQSGSSVQCAVNGAGGYEARRVIEGEGRGIERVEWGRSEKCSDSGRFMQRLKNFRIPIPSFFVLELRRLRGTALSN